MLQLTGKCLGIKSETIGEGASAFISTTMRIEVGSGFEKQLFDVRLGRDFPNADKPRDNEDVVLNVVVTVFRTKNGAGYNLTALSREHKGSRVAAPAGV